jgi:hypothetical protein
MKLNNNDIEVLNKSVTAIVGNKAWGIKIGHGSFLTIEFGNPIIGKSDRVIHGEWHLWVYLCSWRIEKDGRFLVGSEDSKDKMIECVKQMEGCRLESFQIFPQALDAILTFDKGLILRLFPVLSEDEDNEDSHHWMLYMPANKVLVTGPGNRWIIETEEL